MTDNHGETRELVAELALDVAAGEERGRALGHLETCRECRALVGGLADAKDEILLLAPEREPSAGFESRTLARLARDPLRPAGRRPTHNRAPASRREVPGGRGAPAARRDSGRPHGGVPGPSIVDLRDHRRRNLGRDV